MYSEINFAAIDRAIQSMIQSEKKLMAEYNELDSTIGALRRYPADSMQMICRKLMTQKSEVCEEIRRVQGLRAGLEQIRKLYRSNEEKIADYRNPVWDLLIPLKAVDLRRYRQQIRQLGITFR